MVANSSYQFTPHTPEVQIEVEGEKKKYGNVPFKRDFFGMLATTHILLMITVCFATVLKKQVSSNFSPLPTQLVRVGGGYTALDRYITSPYHQRVSKNEEDYNELKDAKESQITNKKSVTLTPLEVETATQLEIHSPRK